MKGRTTLQLLRLAALLGTLAAAGDARAYCRTTTVDSKQERCSVCQTTGYPLAWEHPEITYTFHERGFADFSESTLHTTFREGFDTWQAVTCEGERVRIEARAADETTELGPRDAGVEPTVNVIGYLSEPEWSDEDFDPTAFAQTVVRYVRGSGVIAGADIWFNGGIGTFEVCPADGCVGDSTVDLPNVATHEIGHFLGLGHSDVDGSTMACSARLDDTSKRSLAADDRAGLCAIYPPDLAFRGPYEQGDWTVTESGDSCSVRGHRPALGWIQLGTALGLLALLGWRRRSRIRDDQGRLTGGDPG